MKKTITTILLALTAAVTVLGARTYSCIVPRPLSIEPGEGQLLLEKGTALYASPGLDFETAFLRERLGSVLAFDIPVVKTPSEGGISLVLTEGYGPEAYSLRVDADGVRIEASAPAGIFYGVQTLLQMLPPAVYGDTSLELTRCALDAVTVECSGSSTGWRPISSTASTGIWPTTTAGGSRYASTLSSRRKEPGGETRR